MAKSDLRIVYATFPDQKSAEMIANLLIKKKLAACVNLFPTLLSIYEWEKKLHKEPEIILIAKTHKKLHRKVVHVIEEHHPFEVPCTLVFKVSEANAAYSTWVKKQTI